MLQRDMLGQNSEMFIRRIFNADFLKNKISYKKILFYFRFIFYI